MSLIVDASVAVKWVVPEPDSVKARTLQDEEGDLLAPTLAIPEIANALWKYARRGEITREQACDALHIASRLIGRLIPVEDLAQQAVELAIRLEHPVYDCFYLALAAREGIPVVTADGDLYATARRARIDARLL